MPQYNFCLIPNTQAEQTQFTSYVSRLTTYNIYSKIDRYHLNEKNIPHVSIAHFDLKDENDLKKVWEELQTLKQPSSMQLTFNTKLDTLHNGLMWSLLIPSESEALHAIHNNTLNVIKDPKNLSREKYLPHLTLLSSQDIQKKPGTLKIIPMTANFVTAITIRDDVGQATEVIYRQHDVEPEKIIQSRL